MADFNLDDLIKEVAGSSDSSTTTSTVTVADTAGSSAKSKSGIC